MWKVVAIIGLLGPVPTLAIANSSADVLQVLPVVTAKPVVAKLAPSKPPGTGLGGDAALHKKSAPAPLLAAGAPAFVALGVGAILAGLLRRRRGDAAMAVISEPQSIKA